MSAAEPASRSDTYFRARKIREIAAVIVDVTAPGMRGDQARAGRLMQEIAALAGEGPGHG